MNDKIKQLAEQATDSISYRVCQNTYKEVDDPAGPFVRKEFNKEKFAELIVRECVNTMLNTDEQKFVVETEGWELGGANHNAWDRGILDAVATVKEHFGVED